MGMKIKNTVAIVFVSCLMAASATAGSLSKEEFRYNVLPSLSSVCSRPIPVKVKQLIPDKEERKAMHYDRIDYDCGKTALTIKEGYDGNLSFLYNDGLSNQRFDYKGRLDWKENGKMDIKFYDGFKNINDDTMPSGTSTGFGIVNIKPE